MVLLQALLLALSFVGVFLYFRARYLVQRKCGHLPTLPGIWPVVGHLPRMGWDMFKFVAESAIETEDRGGIVRAWFGLQPVFVVTDPNIAQTIMNSCLQKPYMYQFSSAWVGEGLFTAKLDRWKRTRKLISPTFNQAVLEGFLPVFNAQARRLADSFAPRAASGPFEHQDLIAKNLLETTCQTTMGLSDDMKSIVDDKYIRCVDRVLEIIIFRLRSYWLHPDWIFRWTSLKREEEAVVKFIKQESMKVLHLRKATLDANLETVGKNTETTTRFKTFLEHLLELKGHFTEAEMTNEVDTMIIGGYDTTASTLTLYFVVLGSYPEVQAKVYEELTQVYGDTHRDVTREDLGRLVYLEATLKEVMRLYPIGPAIMRSVLEEVKLDNCILPKGSEVILNIWGLNRSKAWGVDANVFRPERWLDPSTLPENPSAFASFGVGRRACVGKAYAMMSMKTLLVHVLRRYKIKGDESQLKFKFVLLLKTIAGSSVSVERR